MLDIEQFAATDVALTLGGFFQEDAVDNHQDMADHVTCPTLNYQASSYFEETLTRKYIHSPKTIFEKFR